MYNIKQITNFDITDAPEITREVIAGGDIGYDIHGYKTVIYKQITQTLLRTEINKFGYCCEVKALQYPIFLTINGVTKEFQIGKTGMFEIQPDIWTNVNDPDATEQESNVLVTQIEVPWRWEEEEETENYKGYNFKLDFVYSVN